MMSKTPLADGIRNEVFERRRNYAIAITGKVQMRKSTTAIKLAYEIQPDFDIEKQMAIISPKNFLKVLHLEDLKRGDVIVLDEFGIGMNHRQWFTFLNRAINYIMMTHGSRGIILIVTVPYMDYVDSDSQKLFDMIIEVKKKNDQERYATVVVKELQYNQTIKKMYQKLPRGRYPGGIVKRIDAIRIYYPPEDILDLYFKKSEEGKKILREELMAQSEQIERQKISREFSLDFFVNEVRKNIDKYTRIWRGKKIIPVEKLMNDFNIGQVRAAQIKEALEGELNRQIQEGLSKTD